MRAERVEERGGDRMRAERRGREGETTERRR